MKKKYSTSNSIKNIILNFIVITIFFGWIPFLTCKLLLGENILNYFVTIVITLIFSVTAELKDIETFVNSMKNEVDLQKKELINQYNNYMEEKKIELNKQEKLLNSEKQELNKYLNDQLVYKPYLAASISDFLWYFDKCVADYLKFKKRPAEKASDEVKRIANEKRIIEKELRILKYQIGIYEGLFPDLVKYKEATVNDIEEYIGDVDFSEDKARNYLSIEEWNKLSKTQKYQLSLDRYKKSNKTKWQIGRDFERYIGYQYEVKGYKVIYNGAKEGLEDLGRDLIALKRNEILIIQCKYWSENKLIHEKHIFQLYGTTLLKQLESKNKKVKGIFVCTNKLSDTAREIASILNIQLLENYYYDKDYPCIKCNISKATGEKIYHLPFDQQYDNIDIEISKGEKYVSTIQEAEELGFRRAKKYTVNGK